MATGFRSLPLEVRNMIYDHTLEDDYDIFAKGVQAILKVCPEITREIYSYRRIYTTIIVTEFPQRMDPFQINRIFGKAKRFNMVEGRKGLVVRCKAMPLPVAISGNENGRTEMQTPTFRALCSLYKRVMLMRAEQWVKLWTDMGYCSMAVEECDATELAAC